MKRKFDVKYIYTGITALVVIVLSLLFNNMLNNMDKFKATMNMVQSAFAPIFVGIIIAFLLNPLLTLLEKKIFGPILSKIIKKEKQKDKVTRAISIIFTEAIFLALLAAFFRMLIPQLYTSIKTLVTNMPGYYRNFIDFIENINFNNKYVDDVFLESLTKVYAFFENFLSDKLIPNLDTIIVNVSTGVVGGVMMIFRSLLGLVVSIYIMANKDIFKAQSKKILYSACNTKPANLIIDGFAYINRVFSDFFTGKILDSIIIGILCFVSLAAMDMDYAVLISVIVGVTNIIPFFGPFLGAVPCTILLVIIDPVEALVFVVFILILQQVDGNLIGPLILGDSIGISGFWVLTSILVAGGLYGFFGMLLGVPAFACVYALIKYISENRLAKRELPIETDEYKKISRIIKEDDKIDIVTVEECENRRKELLEEAKRLKKETKRLKREKFKKVFSKDKSDGEE